MLFNALLSFLWAFLISVFAIPSIIQVAHTKKLLDEPNLRTVHESLTPRLGGLAIFAGFFSSLTIFGQLKYGVQQLLAASILLFFIGLKDDIISVSAFKKFFVQVLAAIIVLFLGDEFLITGFQGVFDINGLNTGYSYLFTFLVVIGITNSINLIDGLDGLAGSVIMLSAGIFGFYFYNGTEEYLPYAFVAFALLGSILGFLRYNLYKAIIFMGDTGSLVAGFIISILAVKFVEMKPTYNTPLLAIAILFAPILDTLRVFVLRIFVGVSPFSPDKNHLHHRLMDLGMSQVVVVISILLINVGAILLVQLGPVMPINVQLALLITYGLVICIIIELLVRSRKQKLKQKHIVLEEAIKRTAVF